VAIAVSMLAALTACGGGRVDPPPDSLGTVVDFAVPPAIANLPLTKPDGSTTTLAAYRGKTVMVADFLTLCTDICPMISANTAALTRTLNADGLQSKVAVLEITVDPHRDTPARLRAYRKLYADAPANWTMLTAKPRDIARLWKFFLVDYGREKEPKHPDIDWYTHKPLTYDIYHSDDLLFLGADGRERYIVNADPDVQGRLPPDQLVKLLSAEGLNALHHPNPVTDWTVPQAVSVFSWLLSTDLAAPQ
jgi:protein SCO1/2